MQVNKIDHICIAVKDLDEARKIWEPVLGKSGPDYDFIGGARPFRDCEFAFVHPKKMNGVLLELIDYKWEEL
jgi:methylmalonyl-CoA/ethylmalonyl-CoA epimerase